MVTVMLGADLDDEAYERRYLRLCTRWHGAVASVMAAGGYRRSRPWTSMEGDMDPVTPVRYNPGLPVE